MENLLSFEQELDLLLKNHSDLKKTGEETTSRPRTVIPKLVFFNSRDIIIKDATNFCNKIERDVKVLAKFFVKKLGCSYHIKNNNIYLKKRKGSSNTQTSLEVLQNIENQFFKQQILCVKCKSPDTKRIKNGSVICCDSCSHQVNV